MIKIKHQQQLEYLEISNQSAEAKISLQGAHLFYFKAKSKNALLWLSESSHFEKNKAIRGGIPICWPWFGAPKNNVDLPSHGFARTFKWQHIQTQEPSDSETIITFTLKSSTATLKLWPYKFELRLEISISEQLKIALITKNCDRHDFTISCALHSYFLINDIDRVFVDGLDKKSYYDKVNHSYDNLQQGKLVFAQQTDRIYQNINHPLYIRDSDQSIEIKTSGSNTAVIWNPWLEVANKMQDLSDYKTMLCVETANALDDERIIKAGDSHTLTAIISQH